MTRPTCIKGRCRSPTACKGFGHCRDRETGIYIPGNGFGIKAGYYALQGRDGIVALLRKFKTNPEAIQFIADMME